MLVRRSFVIDFSCYFDRGTLIVYGDPYPLCVFVCVCSNSCVRVGGTDKEGFGMEDKV